jgi:MinD-like ATPase involved in chromosome partitioning or flagellar assembly
MSLNDIDRAGYRGRVVAVSATQPGTAKRGVAVGIARTLASITSARICVFDADIHAREVGWRLGVASPTAKQLANAYRADNGIEPLQLAARDERSGIWVVPLGDERNPLERSSYRLLLQLLREHVDYLVVDAPVAFAMHARRIDRLVSEVDELVVAADARPTEFPTLLRYLNALSRGRITGELPADLDVRVVPTGETSPDDSTLWRRAPRGVLVTDAVPNFWGRNAALETATGTVPEKIANVVRELAFA